MEFTSASANKHLRKLQDEKERLLRIEGETSTYVLYEGEEAEPPAYDYFSTRQLIDDIDGKMLAIRHGLHEFNAKTLLPGSQLSIDEALIYLAQLSQKKSRLSALASNMPKRRLRERYFGSNSGAVEYEYSNYDVAQAEADYQLVADQIADLQLELDLVNQTEVFSVDM